MTSCNLAPNHNERMDILRQQLNSLLIWMSRHADLSRQAHSASLQQLLFGGIGLLFSYESFARADHLIFGITPFWAAVIAGAAVYASMHKQVLRANDAVIAHNDKCPEMTDGYQEAHAADQVRREAEAASVSERHQTEAEAYNNALANALVGLNSEYASIRTVSASVVELLQSISPAEFARRQKDAPPPNALAALDPD
jgi:hypothetical protein